MIWLYAYAAGLLLTTFILMILYHAGYDLLDWDASDDNKKSTVVMVIMWPLSLVLSIVLFIGYNVVILINAAARYVASLFRK